MEPNQSHFTTIKFNPFGSDSITLKLLIIGVLVLVLLIPATWLQFLIDERQQRAAQVVSEITDKWSDSQILTGPVLSLPYRHSEVIAKATGEKETIIRKRTAYFLPEQFTFNAVVEPRKLHRGIFEAVVYTATIESHAIFAIPNLEALHITPEQVDWTAASISVGIRDLEGISSSPVLKTGGKTLSAEPVSDIQSPTEEYAGADTGKTTNGLTANLGWQSVDDFSPNIDLALTMRGSHSLFVLPTGKETVVHVEGVWDSPSFDGAFLPEHRDVSSEKFEADWKVLHYNRPFKQQWTGRQVFDESAAFGLRLLIPVEQYQQSLRTAKYAHLIIILTFVALFLLEITQKLRIHPFQYILIGAALIIYYTLLLSFSEQLGFSIAYWIATLATVALITIYSTSFLKKPSLAVMLATALAVSYAFVFVIILQQDLSLLIGSIGLFLVVAALMFFSRRIVWYKESAPS